MDIKLIKELSDKDVSLNQVLLVGFLDFLDDVIKPLPLLLSTGHPDEEHLCIYGVQYKIKKINVSVC